MIKTITKFFAFATILKNLLETKKGDTIHIPNSTITKKEIVVRK